MFGRVLVRLASLAALIVLVYIIVLMASINAVATLFGVGAVAIGLCGGALVDWVLSRRDRDTV